MIKWCAAKDDEQCCLSLSSSWQAFFFIGNFALNLSFLHVAVSCSSCSSHSHQLMGWMHGWIVVFYCVKWEKWHQPSAHHVALVFVVFFFSFFFCGIQFFFSRLCAGKNVNFQRETTLLYIVHRMYDHSSVATLLSLLSRIFAWTFFAKSKREKC